MRNGTIAALLVVALLASAGTGYLVGSANERTVTSTFTTFSTTTLFGKPNFCGLPTNQTIPARDDILQIGTHSSRFVCVDYFWSPTTDQQAELDQQNDQGVGKVWPIPELLASPPSDALATGVNITDVWAVPSPTNETVVYSIATSGNSTGVYTWWAPGTCPGFPLVVGMSISSAQSTLQGYYSGAFMCPFSGTGSTIVGVSGMTIQR
jgi:hypothetical protein